MAYTPGISSGISSLDELRRYVDEELRAISQELRRPDDVNIVKFNIRSSGLDKPRDGMVAFSDGVSFPPPLNQAGLFEHVGGIWKKL